MKENITAGKINPQAVIESLATETKKTLKWLKQTKKALPEEC